MDASRASGAPTAGPGPVDASAAGQAPAPVGATCASAADRAPVVLRALGLGREVDGRALLADVNLAVRAGERVAVLGPSGSGKSLLAAALAGAARPTRGHVLLGEVPIAHALGEVGWVPQGDLLHDGLTLREALEHAARLVPAGRLAGPHAFERAAAGVVAPLGLAHRLGTRLGLLSGGERRRAALALELLARPRALVLDEVTSGLDPASEALVVDALDAAARAGAAVVCVTHTLALAARFDRVVVVVAGRVAFDGAPAAARARFGVDRLDDLYARLGAAQGADGGPARPADAGVEAEARPAVGGPWAGDAPRVGRAAPARAEQARAAPGARLLLASLARQATTSVREGRALAVQLAQAPVIAGLVALAYDAGAEAGRAELAFKLALAALWLGCVGACQELVRERALYVHERRKGLTRAAHLGARALLVLVVAALQAALLVATVWGLADLGAAPGRAWAALAAAAAAGGALGLAVSSLARTRTAAVAATPLVLVPQVLFVGTLTPLSGAAEVLGRAMPSWWADRALRDVVVTGAAPAASDLAALAGFSVLFLGVAHAVTAWRDGASGQVGRGEEAA